MIGHHERGVCRRSTMRGWIVAGVGVVLLGGCSSMGRIMSYGTTWADAIFVVEGRRYEVYAHETDPTLLIQRSIGDAAARGFVKGLTLGVADTAPDYETWKAGAEWMVAPVGCEVRDLKPLQYESTWEFTYVCPPGVDLRSLIEAQREQLRNGVPLDLAR